MWECASRAQLAHKLGVSRDRVTQALGLVALAPDVVQALAALGVPPPKPVVTERKPRAILNLPTRDQKLIVRTIGASLGNFQDYQCTLD